MELEVPMQLHYSPPLEQTEQQLPLQEMAFVAPAVDAEEEVVVVPSSWASIVAAVVAAVHHPHNHHQHLEE